MTPIFLALDLKELDKAKSILSCLKNYLFGIKIGLEFFYQNGKDGYKELQTFNLPIFLDLKLNDIPNTVYNAILSLADISPTFISVHASSSQEILDKAKEASLLTGIKLLGVTNLTSNYATNISPLVKSCLLSKFDGIICSGRENKIIRKEFGDNFLIFNPGIRQKGSDKNDQRRICTPKEAMNSGANYLVMGRSILQNSDPENAIKNILQEIN